MANETGERLVTLLEDLDRIPGVSGAEEQVAEYFTGAMDGLYDDLLISPIGNHTFVKEGSGDLRIMLSAHMDEIGYIVKHIDEDGFVHFVEVGLHDPRTAFNQVMVIHTESGPVRGLTGSKPAHIVSAEEASQAVPISEMFLDVGTSSREETLELGVRVGDYIGYDRPPRRLNGTKTFTGKAVDDRAGVAVLIEVMRRLQEVDHAATVYAVGSVQEELGIRGAGPAAFDIKPDIALALDVTIAGGSPGVTESELPIRMGGGPAIKFFDWAPHFGAAGNAVPRKLTRYLVDLANKHDIPYQREVLMEAATDGWSISLSREGVLTGVLSFPSRYIHSAIGCVHLDDIENTIQLIVRFIEETRESL